MCPDQSPAARTNKESVRTSRPFIVAWLALTVTVALVVVLYVALSLTTSADPLLLPLDDTYIHFQYARQWAHGEPLVYNPGDPTTSGGTSLLYPPLLAAGYLLGFTGWSLAYWALGIGALSFFGAAWLVYLIALHSPLTAPGDNNSPCYALALALAFALSGPFIWAALSGMETALFLFIILLAFYAIQRARLRLAVLAAAGMPLVRPEGLILSALAVLALAAMQPWPARRTDRLRRVGWLSVPLFAGLIQPIVNLLATGSVTSSGMVAKSHLANGSAPLVDRLTEILKFFGRVWDQLLRGRSPDMGIYTSPVLAGTALAGLLIGGWLAWRNHRLNMAVLALAWLLALSAAVATLDTAFWQFKRYQLPVMALFFPAAAWTCDLVDRVIRQRKNLSWARWALPALLVLPAFFTTLTFARNYAANVSVVHDQQVPMARWVAENLPDDARIGVHDVGLMRYFADRALYDVVGLTTPGPAESWRQGPGAIYEHMASSAYRPAYFAIYPDVQGLGYLVNAGVFGPVLAEFPTMLPEHNVAAAAGLQVVYEADWSNTRDREQAAQTTTLEYVAGLELVDELDVANLASEIDHAYHWWPDGTAPGFVTEVYRNQYHACGLYGDSCQATDGGRVLTGGESFTLHTQPGQDLLLVTRVHGRQGAAFSVYANGQWIADRVQPAIPGRWVEVVTWVPGEHITGSRTRIRIEVQLNDPAAEAYMPAYHWAYQGRFNPPLSDQTAVATFGEGGTVRLLRYTISPQSGYFEVELTWLGDAPGTGDGLVFVHLYQDINAPPVAQTVRRPAGDVLPPGNWLPGVIRDTVRVDLPENLPPGTYRVAVGLFDARTGQRYPVSGVGADPDRRLFIGEIIVEESLP